MGEGGGVKWLADHLITSANQAQKATMIRVKLRGRLALPFMD